MSDYYLPGVLVMAAEQAGERGSRFERQRVDVESTGRQCGGARKHDTALRCLV